MYVLEFFPIPVRSCCYYFIILFNSLDNVLDKKFRLKSVILDFCSIYIIGIVPFAKKIYLILF
jgi:hypothetical protein